MLHNRVMARIICIVAIVVALWPSTGDCQVKDEERGPTECRECIERGRISVTMTGPCKPFRCGSVDTATGRRELRSCPDCPWEAVCGHGRPVEVLR